MLKRLFVSRLKSSDVLDFELEQVRASLDAHSVLELHGVGVDAGDRLAVALRMHPRSAGGRVLFFFARLCFLLLLVDAPAEFLFVLDLSVETADFVARDFEDALRMTTNRI